MKTKQAFGVLIVALGLATAPAPGQQSGVGPIFPPPSPVAPQAAATVSPENVAAPSGVLSDWIRYHRDCCDGPHGRTSPLYGEFYFQAGPSMPIGGTTLSRELKTGWSFTTGLRALFFNEPQTRAWVVDVHLINTNESGGRANEQYPVTFFEKGIRSDLVVFEGKAGRKTFGVQNSNRTLAGLGLGRYWYLNQPANSDGCTWRVGVDGGGRWGSNRVNFSEFGHITDVCGGVYMGGQTDVEIPWRTYVFHVGARVEWAYTWTDVLQRNSDVQEITAFLTSGVRW